MRVPHPIKSDFAHRIIEKCSAEVDSFLPQLFILKSDIDEYQEEMLLLQSQRQNDIWTLLERAVKSSFFLSAFLVYSEQVDNNGGIDGFVQVTLWQCTSMMSQQGGARLASPVKDESSSLVSIPCLNEMETSAKESLVVIQENQTLRYE